MRFRRILMATCFIGGLAALPACGTAAFAAEQVNSAIEPDAVAALTRMGSYLRSLQALEVNIDTVREEVDDHDQKLQFLGRTTYRAKRPDGLVVDISEDRRIRHFVYDGKTATLFAPRMGYYTSVSAPPTIKQLLDVMADKYGIVLPIEDLFYWGTDSDGRANLTRGYLVGYAKISGQDADQYAFREDGLDWQIWIARGNKPLPLRVVISDTTDPKLPQLEASLNWNTAPEFAPGTFAFKPPADAKRIPIDTIAH